MGCTLPDNVFIYLQGLGSSQLADQLVNEINQGLCCVKNIYASASSETQTK